MMKLTWTKKEYTKRTKVYSAKTTEYICNEDKAIKIVNLHDSSYTREYRVYVSCSVIHFDGYIGSYTYLKDAKNAVREYIENKEA